MDDYQFARQDMTMKRVLLLVFGLCALGLAILLLWGMVEPWVDRSRHLSVQTSDIVQVVLMLIICILSLWLARVLLHKAELHRQWAERIQRGDVERGMFQVLDMISGVKSGRSGDRTGMVYILHVRHVGSGRELRLRVRDQRVYTAVQVSEVYEIRYIEDYPYVLYIGRRRSS